MNKEQYIGAIQSYLNDGSLNFPSSVANDVTYGEATVLQLKYNNELIVKTVESLVSSQYISLISDNVLSSLRNLLEQLRLNISGMVDYPTTSANFPHVLSLQEQIISTILPYSNLIDSMTYQQLNESAKTQVDNLKKTNVNFAETFQKKNDAINATEENINKLLSKTTSHTLSQGFKYLSKASWNTFILGISIVVAILMFVELVRMSSEILRFIETSKTFNFQIVIAKWLATLPYLLILTFSVLEARKRISLIDQYLFRHEISASLNGYTELLFEHSDRLVNSDQAKAQLLVIEFMIRSMLELTKSPLSKGDSQSFDLGYGDLKAKISSSTES